ncbi:GrpB family protein [Microbacterium sp.]|uniref:GrpB family protein n=1 Tax=Microbacterium sp. TaxID=51671 RepID=UPI0033416411
MSIEVVPYSAEWEGRFRIVEAQLSDALTGLAVEAIEHVGSTAVPGLAAKPILDIDVIVPGDGTRPVISALEGIGYRHRGSLGLDGREALHAPDDGIPRHVYVCVAGTLHVRNHLAVRDALRRDTSLRDRYGAIKTALAADPGMDIDSYLAGKSDVLQEVLAASDLTEAEKDEIYRLNTGG